MLIEIKNGRWTVNGKTNQELTPNEQNALDQFFLNIKNSIVV